MTAKLNIIFMWVSIIAWLYFIIVSQDHLSSIGWLFAFFITFMHAVDDMDRHYNKKSE